MKNLCLIGERRRKVAFDEQHVPSSPNENNNRHIVDMFQSKDDGALIVEGSRFVLTNDGILSKMNDQGTIEWISHLDKVCEENNSSKSGWLNMAYLDSTAEEQIACISKNGAIVTVSPMTGNAELCGEFEHGLEGACWSPDRDSVLLLTFEDEEEETANKKSVLLMMNVQWEVLAEATIDSHIPSLEDPEGESAVSIAFRPDGTLCAVSTVDRADNMRKVRIFKQETLELHAIGRTEDGSGKLVPNMIASAGIAWAGAGCSQLLATAQRKGKKTTQIIFFEPNGLRHREFSLRENFETKVLGLAWNVESDLLAVTLREANEGSSCDKVQLWHRCNYHWYLKQEIRYNQSVRIARAAFDEEKPYTLYVYFKEDLAWREYEWQWHPSSVHITSSQKTCTAYAIDGCSLNMTSLDKALIPPPMCAAALQLNYPVRQLAFCGNDDCPVSSIVHLSDGSFALLGERKDPFSPPEVMATVHLKDLNHHEIDYTSFRSFVVVNSGLSFLRLLAVCCPDSFSSKEDLVVLTIAWEESMQSATLAYSRDKIPLQQSVLCASPWTDSSEGALVGLRDGSIWEFEVSDKDDVGGELHPLPEQEFMEPCQWIAGLKDASSSSDTNYNDNARHDMDEQLHKRLVFGLSSRSRLYCRDILLADAVSSFFVSTDHQFLCYAAAQGSTSQLRFLPLKDLESFDILMGSDENHVLMGFEPRSVERGSRIVAILPGTPQAVLQMPRGNLEGIYPRALVLRYAMNEIGRRQYGEVFTMMRKHKVNLNLIVDLNPKKFLEEDILLFLQQVTTIDHLNLFISCLQNWDSTSTQYRIPPWFNLESEVDVESKKLFDFSTKINQVCTRLRSVMIETAKNGQLSERRAVTEGHFLLPILSTFAKQTPPQLEDALLLIKENAERSANTSKKPPLFSDAAQSSIQYLAFLADYEVSFVSN